MSELIHRDAKIEESTARTTDWLDEFLELSAPRLSPKIVRSAQEILVTPAVTIVSAVTRRNKGS
jgi:hypothetical protein